VNYAVFQAEAKQFVSSSCLWYKVRRAEFVGINSLADLTFN